jgi:putative nucleotidyltransferase with HDIG domain
MKRKASHHILFGVVACLLLSAIGELARAQDAGKAGGPDPREIPVPRIKTPMGTLPGVRELPIRKEMPDVLVMSDGTKVSTLRQWKKRREEMKRILSYYAVGQMPPPPGNVKGKQVKSEMVLGGSVQYRLVHLTFGPAERLGLNVGIFAPTQPGRFPAIILLSGTPPGATPLPRLPQGPNQGRGEDVLLLVGPLPATGATASSATPAAIPAMLDGPAAAQATASQNADLFRRGYALVVFNPNDCAEDTTLRNLDGSWAFRNTRFLPAYPGYDWGILAGWAWGASRVADYLVQDSVIDKTKLIIAGASRNGKAAMIAAAFDDRLMGAPVVTGGGGIGAYRFAGPRKSETLDIMQKKYPNWFSPNLHEFWGQRERLPFDQHWFLSLAAPRPFIASEGMTDTISLPEAVRQSILGAQPAYALFNAQDRLGVHYANHGHAFTGEDWTALMDFFDKCLLGKKIDRAFDRFPTERELDEAAAEGAARTAAMLRARAWDAVQSRVKEEKYLNHSRAVEAIMREMAVTKNENPDEWGLAGLVHDIDISSIGGDMSRHGVVGAQILHDLGFSTAIERAVHAHDDRAGVERTTRLDHGLFCADQVYWLILAAGINVPSEELDTAVPEMVWRRVQGIPSKTEILDKVSKECEEIGFSMPQLLATALAGLRRVARFGN